MTTPAPLATIFYGDVTLERGSDPSHFGYGDLNVKNNVVIGGSIESVGGSSAPVGALIVKDGGAYIHKSLYVKRNLDVSSEGITNIHTTNINTDPGALSVFGQNAVDINIASNSRFNVYQGDLQLTSCTGSVFIAGGATDADAVSIRSSNTAGGVTVDAGTSGLTQNVSGGQFLTHVIDGSGEIRLDTFSNNQNLTMTLTGSTDSAILLQSSGIDAAIELKTRDTNGKIILGNEPADGLGLGAGAIEMWAGSGGYTLQSNTGGEVRMTSQDADFCLSLRGTSSQKSLILESEGISQRAIHITNTDATSGSLGGISLDAGMGGLIGTSYSGGSTGIVMTAVGGSSLYTNRTYSNGQNLTVSVTGNTDSRVIIRSEGTGQGAITLESTGGILATSDGKVSLQTRDAANGIHIATDNDGVPVFIGRNGSDVTVRGNLFVRGTTTEVNQQVMTVDDNIIVVNNSPFGLYDGGLAVKRYQPVNDINEGALVGDTPELVGTVGNAGNSNSTINLGTSLYLSDQHDYYKNWWVRISGGQGQGQWRKISGYDGDTKIASIYTTNEPDVQPSQGNIFTTTPNNTSIYGLYPCEYVMNIWDESNNEFAYVCTPTNPSDPDTGNIDISHYTNLHVGTLIADNIQAPLVNNGVSDIHFEIELSQINTISSPVLLNNQGVLNYGLYMIYIKPETDMSSAYGIFMVGRRQNANPSDNAPGTIVRIISVKGARGEHLDMDWPSAQFPRLYYRPQPTEGGITKYKIKMISI